MDDTNIEDKLKNLNINQKTDINILLLGGTGVGKSTMINSIANYLTYGDLKKAKKDKLMVLIPTQFHVKDKNGKTHTISTGENDQNEFLQVGESATQDVKTYVFPIWNGQVKIRLIDTPGMGDTRGITQDDVNSENILSYIGNLHELHAICFLLKPNESRDTVFFKYCMNQIFSRLDKSACTNIIFCFTNTRGSDYTPGETVGILTKNIEEIRSRPPYAEIPLNRNIFCFDNEPFKYLAAVKKDVEFDSDIKERNKESWKKSAEQCWSLINYIVGDKKNKPLKPHFVKSTNAINEARRMINQLAQPLAEITQLIHQNMNVLERHKDILQVENMSIEEMKKKLYMPVLALEITQLTQPVTVCAARKCAEVLKTAGENVWHYKQRCHDPCFLTNVPKEVIGSPELTHCAAMGGTTTCTKCHCDFKVHMHVYYLSKVIEKQEKDSNMQKKITTREQLVDEKRKIMGNIEYKQQELDEEHRIVVETCAKFAHFLQNNAITPFNDAYKEYIEYLINREKSLGNLCDKETVKHLQGLLLKYVQIKNRFDEALKSTRLIGRDDIITSKEIYDSIQTLYKLKHNGKKIKELYECQKKSRTKEFQNTEYVHNVIKLKQSTPLTDEDKKKPKNKDNKDKKNKDAKNDRQQRGSTASDDAGRPRGRSPPPTYQEARRNERLPQHRNPNYNSNGYPDQGPYRPNMGPAPNMGPVPPLMGPNVFPPPGPHWQQGGPSRGNNNQYEFAVNRGGAPAGSEYDVNIVFKKRNEPKGEYPPYNFQPYNDPIYPHQNPNYPPQHPNYPPQNPNYPPQHFGYPSNYPPYGQYYGDHQRYDYHHGVNRQNSGANNYQGPSARGGYQGPRGNEQGRGGENRGQKGRGGINKRTRGKKPKGNEKENSKSKKEDKPKKGKKSSSDSDDSDSSSD